MVMIVLSLRETFIKRFHTLEYFNMQDFHLATSISMFINSFLFLVAAEYCIVLILATGETIMVCEVADNGNEL